MNDTRTTSTALRQVADLLDAHPDLPLPYVTTSFDGTASASWYLDIDHDHAGQKAEAGRIVKALGGKWDKAEGGDDFHLRQRIGLVQLTVSVDRPAVCERVVTGTETVTIPAKPAEAERVETVETVEWVCQPLLAESPLAVSA